MTAMGRTPQEKFRIEQRRQQVADLYVTGATQSQIARQLGVAQSTVSVDLKAIRREWRNSRIRDFDEAVAVEIRKLDNLEREAWSGWERSQQPAESTKVTQDVSGKKAEKVVKQQGGDPRYLEQVHRCIVSRRTLLGLDAPTRIAPTSPDGKESYHAYAIAELMRLSEEMDDGPTVIDATYIEEEVKRLTNEEKNNLQISKNEKGNDNHDKEQSKESKTRQKKRRAAGHGSDAIHKTMLAQDDAIRQAERGVAVGA